MADAAAAALPSDERLTLEVLRGRVWAHSALSAAIDSVALFDATALKM
jgi:hypothetical protein